MNRPNSSAVILGQGDCLGLPPSNTSGNCFRKTKTAIGQRNNSIYMPPIPLAACGYSTPSTPSCIYSSRPQQEAEESHRVTFREGTRALDSSNRRQFQHPFWEKSSRRAATVWATNSRTHNGDAGSADAKPATGGGMPLTGIHTVDKGANCYDVPLQSGGLDQQ